MAQKSSKVPRKLTTTAIAPSSQSLACPQMPNFFLFMGPNATVGHGSLIYSLDWTAEWMIQWLRKMGREDIASVAPKQDVVDELVRYGDEIMKTLTWTGNCMSPPQDTTSPSPLFVELADIGTKVVHGTNRTGSTAG